MYGNEEKKLQKYEYQENRKFFILNKKNIFHSFWMAIIWWKIKIWENIAGTSFKKIIFIVSIKEDKEMKVKKNIKKISF